MTTIPVPSFMSIRAKRTLPFVVTDMLPDEIERSVHDEYPNAEHETVLLIWCPLRALPETMAYAVVHDDKTRRAYEDLAHGLSLCLVRTRLVYLLESKG